MQNIARTVAIGATAFVVMSLGLQGAAAQSISLRISGENPLAGLDMQMAQRFAENLETALGDDFEHEFFHTQALGDEVVHMQMIRSGQIDVYPFGSDAVQLDPSWAMFDMPFLIGDREDVARLLDGGIGEELRDSMREAAGLEVLAFGELGFRQITNNVRPITVPQDLAGVRLRVPGSETRVLTFETYGASPVSMNLGELYLAMQSGTVDGQENPLADITSRSFEEVQDYLSMSNHVYTPVTLVMNGAKFDALSAEHQQAVMEAAQEAAEYTRQLGTQADEDLLSELEASDAIAINQIDRAAFEAASAPVWTAIGEMADQGFINRVIEAAAQ